jgi:hypothetical protein
MQRGITAANHAKGPASAIPKKPNTKGKVYAASVRAMSSAKPAMSGITPLPIL